MNKIILSIVATLLLATPALADTSTEAWVDRDERKIVVTTLPSREQIDTQIQEPLVVELYSK